MKVEDFLKHEPADLERRFNILKKEEYLLIAEHFELPVTSRMRKDQIREMVAKVLVERKYLKSFEFSETAEEPSLSEQLKYQFNVKKLEMQMQMQKEEREMQMQMQKEEREMQIQKEEKERERDREFELEKNQIRK